MFISNNDKGNKYHDEKGRFTSPNAADLGLSLEDFEQFKKNGLVLSKPNQIELKDDIDLDEVLSQFNFDDNVDDILSDFFESQKGLDFEFSTKTESIMKNLLSALDSEKYVDEIDAKFNYDANGYSDKTSHTYFQVGSQNFMQNVFVQELSKARFPLRANAIDKETYDKFMDQIKTMGSGQLTSGYTSNKSGFYGDNVNAWYFNIENKELRDLGSGLIAVQRGLELGYYKGQTVQDAFSLKQRYLDSSEEGSIYSKGSGNHGSCYYFAMQKGYADKYSVHFGEKEKIKAIIHAQDANIIGLQNLEKASYDITEELDNNSAFATLVKNKFYEKLLQKNTPDEARNKSEILYDNFYNTLNCDLGLTALLCGAQLMIGKETNGNQCNVYDLSIVDIYKDW